MLGGTFYLGDLYSRERMGRYMFRKRVELAVFAISVLGIARVPLCIVTQEKDMGLRGSS